jgi:hypothetical protein
MNFKSRYFLILTALFLLSHVLNITILPVFADEAIYIRWGQFFGREPIKYLFFPLYDGKTPLFIWIVGICSKLPLDPLFIGRAISVISSLVAAIATAKLTELISPSKRTFTIAFLLWTLLPFSLIYSRLALIDMMLTMWLSVSLYFFFSALLESKKMRLSLLLPGLFWGLALYFLPVYLVIFLLARIRKQTSISINQLIYSLIGFALGSGMLLVMIITPLFPFLFQRGADFTFSSQEILFNLPHILVTNTFRMGKWLILYCSPLMLLTIYLLKEKKPQVIWLFVGLLFWLLPFLITGKVLSSRYILPSLIFIVPLMAGAFIKIPSKFKGMVAIVFITYCLYWNYFLLFNPNATPFPIEDRVQFLTDWSSGHGIKQSAEYLIDIAKTQKVLVATEGFFGTLPDGLMIYLDGKPELDNMRVEGVGLPIFGIPKLLAETSGFDRKFVIVNEHRFVADPLPSKLKLIQKYARPHGGPALLLLEYEE